MKKIKTFLKKLTENAIVLTISFLGYIATAMIVANVTQPVLKTAVYILFLIFFVVFTGTIISLMDLKYIGKGFLEKQNG